MTGERVVAIEHAAARAAEWTHMGARVVLADVATDRLWPGVLTVPIMVMGATDGRMLRAAGIPTYGIQGFFMDRDDIRMHGRDERMLVTSFYEGQTFLYDLVKAVSKPAP